MARFCDQYIILNWLKKKNRHTWIREKAESLGATQSQVGWFCFVISMGCLTVIGREWLVPRNEIEDAATYLWVTYSHSGADIPTWVLWTTWWIGALIIVGINSACIFGSSTAVRYRIWLNAGLFMGAFILATYWVTTLKLEPGLTQFVKLFAFIPVIIMGSIIMSSLRHINNWFLYSLVFIAGGGALLYAVPTTTVHFVKLIDELSGSIIPLVSWVYAFLANIIALLLGIISAIWNLVFG